jgi:hypothetical protein
MNEMKMGFVGESKIKREWFVESALDKVVGCFLPIEKYRDKFLLPI